MIKYLDQIEVQGKRVLMRVDFNVPLDDQGNITDDLRIQGALPSIRYVLENQGRLILCSHLGRPKGKRVPEYSLKPVAAHLSKILGFEVPLAPDCIGPEAEEMAEKLEPGKAMLLENLRYHEGETKNDPAFADALAKLADVYVNDAFAVSHRAHASVVGVPSRLSECAAGFLLKKELDYFNRAMESPARPLVAVLGGAKVSGKLGAIEHILQRVDKVIIGGAMANTFLKAQGLATGSSLVEDDLLDTANDIVAKAKEKGIKFYLPVDAIIAQELSTDVVIKTVPVQEIPEGWMALDIGPASARLFQEVVEDAKTIVWNGPMGAFEIDLFSQGTRSMAEAIGNAFALSISGGGDTNAAIKKFGQADNISYMSTGGGAFLTLLEGKVLPGVKALEECSSKG